MTLEQVIVLSFTLAFGAFLIWRLLQAFYTPDSWLRFVWCHIRFRHEWSEPYRPDTEGYSPELQKCECCGMKKKANPPAPLVP